MNDLEQIDLVRENGQEFRAWLPPDLVRQLLTGAKVVITGATTERKPAAPVATRPRRR